MRRMRILRISLPKEYFGRPPSAEPASRLGFRVCAIGCRHQTQTRLREPLRNGTEVTGPKIFED